MLFRTKKDPTTKLSVILKVSSVSGVIQNEKDPTTKLSVSGVIQNEKMIPHNLNPIDQHLNLLGNPLDERVQLPDWAEAYDQNFKAHLVICCDRYPETIVQLHELSFAFRDRLDTLSIILEKDKHLQETASFRMVVRLIHLALTSEEKWPSDLVLSKQTRDLLIHLVLVYIPFSEKTIDQLYQLNNKYLLLVLREPYVRSLSHGYPERYADYVAREIDKFYGYQELMSMDDKYAYQAVIENNYVRMAEDDIRLYTQAKASFEQTIKSFGCDDSEEEEEEAGCGDSEEAGCGNSEEEEKAE